MDLKIETRPIDRLIPYARDARTHSDDQVAQIAASIAEFGFVNPVLVGADDMVIAGHGRLLCGTASRHERGAGDRARSPERSAAPGAGDCRQPDCRERRLGRTAAAGRACHATRAGF